MANTKKKALRIKLALNVINRLTVMRLLPPTGTVLEQSNVRHIVRSVELTVDENEEMNKQVAENGQLKLEGEANYLTKCEFTASQISLIGEILEKMDTEGKVGQNELQLFPIFLPEKYSVSDIGNEEEEEEAMEKSVLKLKPSKDGK